MIEKRILQRIGIPVRHTQIVIGSIPYDKIRRGKEYQPAAVLRQGIFHALQSGCILFQTGDVGIEEIAEIECAVFGLEIGEIINFILAHHLLDIGVGFHEVGLAADIRFCRVVKQSDVGSGSLFGDRRQQTRHACLQIGSLLPKIVHAGTEHRRQKDQGKEFLRRHKLHMGCPSSRVIRS